MKESIELLFGFAGKVVSDAYYSYKADEGNAEKPEELREAIMHDILEYIRSNEGLPVYFSGIMLLTDRELNSAQKDCLRKICKVWFASGDMIVKIKGLKPIRSYPMAEEHTFVSILISTTEILSINYLILVVLILLHKSAISFVKLLHRWRTKLFSGALYFIDSRKPSDLSRI